MYFSSSDWGADEEDETDVQQWEDDWDDSDLKDGAFHHRRSPMEYSVTRDDRDHVHVRGRTRGPVCMWSPSSSFCVCACSLTLLLVPSSCTSEHTEFTKQLQEELEKVSK